MRRKPCLAALFVALTLCAAPMRAQAVTARQRMDQLAMKTSLNLSGMKPWHLRISFQLYGMAGNHQEDGTIEEWWVAPHRLKLIVTSPSFHRVLPADPEALETASREGFLVEALWEEIVHPIRDDFEHSPPRIKVTQRTYDGFDLTCMQVGKPNAPNGAYPEECVERDTGRLRLTTNEYGFVSVRNQLAKFQDIELAMDTVICLGGKIVVTGHVEALELIDPPSMPVAVTSADSRSEYVAGDVLTYKVLKAHKAPYPDDAKAANAQGPVIICAMIAKDGHLSSLDTVDSPHPSLSKAAVYAVRQGVFSPPLLNGHPTVLLIGVILLFNLDAPP